MRTWLFIGSSIIAHAINPNTEYVGATLFVMVLTFCLGFIFDIVEFAKGLTE